MKVCYLAHQLSPTSSWDEQRNRESAMACAKLLVTRLNVAVSADWIWLSQALDDGNPEHRALGLECDKVMIGRCDVLLLCGPTLSSGMRVELDEAFWLGKRVINLTGPDYMARLEAWIDEQPEEMKRAA
jgi:hypothetical protein